MVGRRAELDALLAAFDLGAAGHPRAVVIRGEAGIGKTRLIQEFLAAVAARGHDGGIGLVVATGQCVDLGPIGAPFTPIRRLLHELYAAVGIEAVREAAGSPAVAATLGTLIPELAGEDAALPPGGADYVSEAIERLIENLSAERHLVLVIEDMHWADAATLALLKTLAVTLRGSHVTMVMTYRSDDVGRGHPLRPVLAELDRSRVVSVVEIGRLSADDVAEQAGLILGRPADAAELRSIVGRSEGVPFFVEELVELAGGSLPDTLRDVVLARFERLTPGTRRVVETLSAGGVHVDHDLLVEVTGGDGLAVEDGAREAMAAHTIVAETDGYTFRHALIQEAVHDDLLPSQRVALHAAYATAIQRRVDAGQTSLAADLAEHRLASRDVVGAFDATVIALRDARAALAMWASVRLGERLLELWPQVPDASARVDVAEHQLYLGILRDLDDLGDSIRGIRVAQLTLDACPSDDNLARAEVLHLLGGALTASGDTKGALACAEDAIECLASEDVPAADALRAEAFARIATNPHYRGDWFALLERAEQHALDSEDAEALAFVLRRRASYYVQLGWWDEAPDAHRRAVLAATRPASRLVAINNEMDLHVRRGRYEEAIRLGREGMSESTAVGLDRGIGAIIASNLAEALVYAGHLDEGLTHAARASELLTDEPGFRSFAFRIRAMAELWDDREPSDALAIRLDPLVSASIADGSDEQIGWAHVDIDVALAGFTNADSPVERARFIAEALHAAEILGTPFALESPGLSVGMLPSAARALRQAVGSGADQASTAVLATRLDAAVDALTIDGPDAATRALVAAERAESDATAAWRHAVAETDEGLVPCRLRHYARYRLAQALVEEGARDEAAPLLIGIVTEAPGEGVRLVARWARELAGRAGIVLKDMDSSARATGSGGVAASGVPSLTPRELQVLALVAEGLTNPQIGQRLFISPKTASVHVSAILAKIGAANRTEAAALYSTAGMS